MKYKLTALIAMILLISQALYAEEMSDPELNEAVRLQREIGKVDKELELVEKQAKIMELKRKMAQDQRESHALQGDAPAAIGPAYQQADVNLIDISSGSETEVKMILISADSRKAIIKSGSGYVSVKVGETINDWQVVEIDKESVLFKKGEELKRYKIALW